MTTFTTHISNRIRLCTGAVAMAACLAPQLSHAFALAPREPAKAIGTLLLRPPADDRTAAASKGAFGVPDAKVWLQDRRQRQVGDAAVTELDGKFRLSAPASGVHVLCWDIQGRTACDRTLDLKPYDNYIGLIEVRLKQPYVYGTVLNRDERACWERDPFFKIDVSTKVGAFDGGGSAVAQTRANARGQYVLALTAAGPHKVQAACEKAEVAGAVPAGADAFRLDLRLPNRAPRLMEFAARAQGRNEGIFRADPGQKIDFGARAVDPDNDAVEYLIRSNNGAPVATGPTGFFSTVAPMHPGRYSNYLMARDGRGGYAWKRVDLEVGPPVVRVTGNVVDEFTRQPVAGATVELGGSNATTDARGNFALKTAETTDRRYVLNIRHSNYSLNSQVFDRSMTGNTFGLIPAHVETFDPNKPLRLNDRLVERRCDNQRGADNKNVVRRIQPTQYQGDVGEKPTRPIPPDLIKRLTSPLPCLRTGAQIVVPPGALVNAATGAAAAAGSARAAITTFDPTQRPIPGDYQAIDRSGRRSELLSYGAVDAEFRDAAGNLLNLKPGATAEIRVPVPAAQQQSAKPTIDFWSYDEKSGRWQVEGTAKLVTTNAGLMYVGKTTHFSTLNMDVSGFDPAESMCVRVELSAPLLTWSNLKLRATVSYSGDSVQTKEMVLDAATYHAIFRIPYDPAVFPPNTLRMELFGDVGGTSVVLVDTVINSAVGSPMPTADLWPPSPYSACFPVLLVPDPIELPEYESNSTTNRPYFLTGPGGAWLPTDGEVQATNYYNALDPAGAKNTLQDWWVANSFGVDGTLATRVSYLNHNDLGFGRDMHCRQNGANLACYVTNYGAPNNNATNADDAESQNAAARGATVAMEFNAAAAAGDGVQFYVYGQDPAAVGKLKFADLDGFGPKPVPQLCQVCHGGGPGADSATGIAKFARFREFDMPSLRYSGARTFDFSPAPLTLSLAELIALKDLNLKVKDAHPGTPIGNLIDQWYPVGGGVTDPPVKPAPPAAWAGSATTIDAYHSVYGTSCRTCHIARDAGSPTGYYVFGDSGNFISAAPGAVCGFKVMPNAIITYQNFWQDPTRILQFEALTGTPANTCKN